MGNRCALLWRNKQGFVTNGIFIRVCNGTILRMEELFMRLTKRIIIVGNGIQ